MHILFLEKHSQLSEFLKRALSAEAVSCFNINDYESLDTWLQMADQIEPDIVVLNQDFESRVATHSIPKIKHRWPQVKVMVLAEVEGAKERIRFLELGADDCMTQPIDVSELMLRLRLLFGRRSARNTQYLDSSNVELSSDLKDVVVAGQRMNLNKKEYLLAETLLGHPNKVFSKVVLLDLAWGIQSDVESNVVEVTMSSLRKKLEKGGATVAIKSRRNAGYWLEPLAH